MKKILFIFFTLIMVYQLSAQDRYRGLCATRQADVLNQPMDTVRDRGLANNYLLWDDNATILVKFLPGGSQKLRNDVIRYASLWEKYTNVKFKFVPDNTPVTNIRVKLNDQDGAWSQLGTRCNNVKQNEPTLNLDTIGFLKLAGEDYWKGTIIHEFGHALGLLHEQGFPGAIKWNKTNLYKYYKETNNWDKDMVDAQVFEVYDQFYTNGTQYDPKSVMHYSVQAWQTTDGFTVKDNNDISTGDIALISALYPKNSKRSNDVPRVSLTDVKNELPISNDNSRKRILIYPSFTIETSEKLGEVWCVAQFYDEEGFAILDDDKSYNWGGGVAAYTKLNLLPKQKVKVNDATRNLELSIPIDQVPGYGGKKVMIQTKAYLFDPVNKKLIPLYFSDPVEYRMPVQ